MQYAPAPGPGVPPPPPQLNLKMLWGSLLLPPAIMVLCMVLLNLFPDVMNNQGGETALMTICIAACVSALAGWVLFIICLCKRFRGISLVLLILGYPILQVCLLFTIFFVGCIGLIAQDNVR